jgi:hypothetical protein
MYRRMRKALIREIAPDTVLDWVEAEEYVMAQCLASQPGHRAARPGPSQSRAKPQSGRSAPDRWAFQF